MKLCVVLAFIFSFTGSSYGTIRNGMPQEESLPPELLANSNDTDFEDVHWLSEIKHFTRSGKIIDISIDSKQYTEVCYIKSPNGNIVEASLLEIDGVTVQKKSKYVSCRISITMNEGLIGKWILCGKSVYSGDVRCQPVTISWNRNNENEGWSATNETSFIHPVHIGGSVNSGVSGLGEISTCHVVTPSGEDLVITTDVTYSHIERTDIDNSVLCSILIKDITQDMLGSWVIYGRFQSALGQTEVRLPLTFRLFNEDRPYEQAYNITAIETQKHLVNIGSRLSVEVAQRSSTTEICLYVSPSGEIFTTNSNISAVPEGVVLSNTDTTCRIDIDPITEETIGEWQIIGRFTNGVLFDERHLSFHIIKEDPENPLPDTTERVIENLTQQNILTDMNTTHTLAIISDVLLKHESCHLISPDGLQYAFIPGFNVPNVKIIEQDGIECGIVINLETENMIGEWTLFSRAMRLSVPIERRLSFNLRVEENFVIQDDINIREGKDLYLHLNGFTSTIEPSELETCKLFGPNGTEYTGAEVDPVYTTTCGYVLRNVDQSYNGTWVIEYGHKIKRRGSVNVLVIDSEALALSNMNWRVGDSINMSVGPEDAVYCKIWDTFGHSVFDNFGQCKIVLDRVNVNHGGHWSIFIGLPGLVRLQQYGFYVNVYSRDNVPIVSTNIKRNDNSVMLTCSIPAQHEVHACKFRDPRNNVLVAAHGVGQGNYMFQGTVVNYQSDAQSHDCTLRIVEPSVLDMGIWRCALNTSTGTYYGFLTVLIPEVMQGPAVGLSYYTEPVLRPMVPTQFEGEPVTMSCSISAALRYCYFRAKNGTVYNVFPRMPREDNFEYFGAGLDAGECGIRFNRFSVKEARGWSCHVGLAYGAAKELRENVTADVIPKMVGRHYLKRSLMMVLEARVYNGHALDYCRFVRADGFGFTSDNLPLRYSMDGSMHMGFCILYISNPNIFDYRPWTIAVKLMGVEGEISMTTADNLLVEVPRSNYLGEILFMLLIIILCLIPIMAAAALISKSNRDWTSRRANRLRESFRTSWSNRFTRKPLVQT